jgi:hypothetical protein
MIRSLIALLALVLCVSCLFLVANGKAARTATATKRAPLPQVDRVLFIGDSLSVGPFGESIQGQLAQRFGVSNVAAYASCGSSPEHWLQSTPVFWTKCGYRESTPTRPPVMTQFSNGRPPRPRATPKLETLVRRHRATIVVVQLGTNWMDRPLTDAQMSSIIDRFVAAARSGPVRQIIWIAPPDHPAMAKRQGRIHQLIQQAAQRRRFEVIDSRQVTRYVRGQTGGDGIHYNTASSRAWAQGIRGRLEAKLAMRRTDARARR